MSINKKNEKMHLSLIISEKVMSRIEKNGFYINDFTLTREGNFLISSNIFPKDFLDIINVINSKRKTDELSEIYLILSRTVDFEIFDYSFHLKDNK